VLFVNSLPTYKKPAVSIRRTRAVVNMYHTPPRHIPQKKTSNLPIQLPPPQNATKDHNVKRTLIKTIFPLLLENPETWLVPEVADLTIMRTKQNAMQMRPFSGLSVSKNKLIFTYRHAA